MSYRIQGGRMTFGRTACRIAPPKLTKRQQLCADLIYKLQPCTVRMVQKAMGIKSTYGVDCHLEALVRKGVIDWPIGKSAVRSGRTIRIKKGVDFLGAIS